MNDEILHRDWVDGVATAIAGIRPIGTDNKQRVDARA